MESRKRVKKTVINQNRVATAVSRNPVCLYSRRESNPYQKNRNLSFYPLNYRSGWPPADLSVRERARGDANVGNNLYFCKNNMNMDVRIEPTWKKALATEWDKDYFKNLTDFVRSRYATRLVFPPASKIFAAFDSCPFDKVKVVILGQDPYPGLGQANGLSFSVNPGVALPRSLCNIYKELSDDLGVDIPPTGDLTGWARSGVLMLNATLTVDANAPASHQGQGWETFTDTAIRRLADEREGLVFILWGAYAQRKREFIDPSRHCVICSAHPSPLSASRGFFGSKPFSRANDYLISRGQEPVDWYGSLLNDNVR